MLLSGRSAHCCSGGHGERQLLADMVSERLGVTWNHSNIGMKIWRCRQVQHQPQVLTVNRLLKALINSKAKAMQSYETGILKTMQWQAHAA